MEVQMLGTWDVKRVAFSCEDNSGGMVDVKVERGHGAAASESGKFGIAASTNSAHWCDLTEKARSLLGKTEGFLCDPLTSPSGVGTCVADDDFLYVIKQNGITKLPWSGGPSSTFPNPPEPFISASCVLHDSNIFIYVGDTGRVWTWCTQTTKYKPFQTCGAVPGRRKGQAMTLIGDDYIVLHGGEVSGEYIDSDLYLMDIKEREWYRTESEGQETCRPSSLSGHSLTAVGRRLIVFGGFLSGSAWAANTELFVATFTNDGVIEWSLGRARNPGDNAKPSATAYHNAALIKCQSDPKLVIFGGVNQSDETVKHPSLYLIHLKTDVYNDSLPKGWSLDKTKVKQRVMCMGNICECVIA
eukprot:TRINITY_DN9389_c1_g1_i1.p1 TRINITY_DN9389_c1_g1~~TRINITY_DN9389_c1_g1_i1.p1  ORF type:complete len:376 (+),score=51.84 TRINITY_DN9389_c1_g1_i1:60-1130(+)